MRRPSTPVQGSRYTSDAFLIGSVPPSGVLVPTSTLPMAALRDLVSVGVPLDAAFCRRLQRTVEAPLSLFVGKGAGDGPVAVSVWNGARWTHFVGSAPQQLSQEGDTLQEPAVLEA